MSDPENGLAHGSNIVYSVKPRVIQGLTGKSIELQPCLGMSWYDLRLECSTSMYEQSTDILDQARFVTV